MRETNTAAAIREKAGPWVTAFRAVPTGYWAVGMAVVSLLWAITALAYALHTRGPSETIFPAGRFGVGLSWLLRHAGVGAVLLGTMGAARDEEHRRAGLVGICLGLSAVVAWAVVRSLERLLSGALL